VPNICENILVVVAPTMEDAVAFTHAHNVGRLLAYAMDPPGDTPKERSEWLRAHSGIRHELGVLADDPEDDTELLEAPVSTAIALCFDTAWYPPLGFYEALHARGWKVHASYCEMGSHGIGTWENGVEEFYRPPQNLKDWNALPEDLRGAYEHNIPGSGSAPLFLYVRCYDTVDCAESTTCCEVDDADVTCLVAAKGDAKKLRAWLCKNADEFDDPIGAWKHVRSIELEISDEQQVALSEGNPTLLLWSNEPNAETT
jgi:hypothetical protein